MGISISISISISIRIGISNCITSIVCFVTGARRPFDHDNDDIDHDNDNDNDNDNNNDYNDNHDDTSDSIPCFVSILGSFSEHCNFDLNSLYDTR
jgi:hypothetical protein